MNGFGTAQPSSTFGSTTPSLFAAPSPVFGMAPAATASAIATAGGSSSTFTASGANSSSFGGFPLSGQNHAFGGFGLTADASQQTQASFGTGLLPEASRTSVFGPSSSSTFSTGLVTEPSRTYAFGPPSSSSFATGLLPEPSRTYAFGPSSAPSFATGVVPEPSRTSVFGPSRAPSFATGLLPEASRTSLFGPSSAPAFPTGLPPEASRTSLFGPSSAPAFATRLLPEASRTSLFGPSSAPAFATPLLPEASRTSLFGPSSSPAFTTGLRPEASSTSLFGPSSAPSFATSLVSDPSRTSVFGPSSAPSFATGLLPQPSRTSVFGPSNSQGFAIGLQPEPSRTFAFGPSTAPTFATGLLPEPLAGQTTRLTNGCPSFEQSAFRGLRGGTRVTAYVPTAEMKGFYGENSEILKSISAMPFYQEKSHEELKWEDYQLRDRDVGLNPVIQSTAESGIRAVVTPSKPFDSLSMCSRYAPTPEVEDFNVSQSALNLNSISAIPFYKKKSHEELKWEHYQIRDKDRGLNPAMQSNHFSPPPTPAQPSMNTLFRINSSDPFTPQTTILGPSGFETTSTPSFNSSPSVPSSTTTTGLNFSSTSVNTQACPLFQPGSSLVLSNPAFKLDASSPGQSTFPSFLNSNIFTTPSTEVARNLAPKLPSLCPTCNQVDPGPPIPFIFNIPQPTQPGGATEPFFKTNSDSSSFKGIPSVLSRDTSAQVSAAPVTGVLQPSPVTNSFGTLPAMPQMSVAHSHSGPSIQHGISSMPVTDKPTCVRISILKSTRHLSHGRIKLPARKYNPKTDGQKVPFFSGDEIPRPPNADVLFSPRDNPRAVIVGAKYNADKSSLLKNTTNLVNSIGNTDQCSLVGDGQTSFIDLNFKPSGVHDDEYTSIELTSRKSSDGPVMHDSGTDVESLMPKLQNSEYYTEPSIQDLAAKERAEPGFCCRVKDFVVGHYSYGCIKFPGETDVRKLDLESIIRFNNREVIVYMDESKSPPVGQGLNKLAEVTLLNIKCLDKKTGKQCMDEAKVDKYKALLIKKAKDQGAEFVSFDPARGEWKFIVQHFSK